MITGFNTDIEHEGVVYHVQTEDKGLASPLILSLVYSGGEILASKRSRYEDLIAAGFDESVLSARLKRQHRLICAAINAGRLEELKRMGARAESEAPAAEVSDEVALITQAPEVDEAAGKVSVGAVGAEASFEPAVEVAAVHEATTLGNATADETELGGNSERPVKHAAYTVYDSRRQAPLDEAVEPETGVTLTLLNEDEFLAGESIAIRVLLEDRSRKENKPVAGIAISVKILGASFRPQIHSVKTEHDGVAVISATMPSFTSGRAAVLVRAVVKGQTVELRRVIHPAE